MIALAENQLYRDDIRSVAELQLPWNSLRGKTLALTGATGQIGSFLVDVILHKNAADSLGCKIITLGRDADRIKTRFCYSSHFSAISFIPWSFGDNTPPNVNCNIDFLLHLASNTHPISYATDPVGTIEGNVLATNNLLKLAITSRTQRFLFASSNEIYGENRGDSEFFDESYCGYIDCNTLRAGYPESKRCGEALCQAYIRQHGLDCVVARLTRTYGPTILPADTKAISQFFKNALAGVDIVLKSAGTQFYSYLYVADSVSGLLTILLQGTTGAAYNIADPSSDITLRDLASQIAACAQRKVVFNLPSATEQAGFSKATKARLDGTKLHALGWSPRYDIATGIKRTFAILT